ncbi:MAG: hypothetical protein HFE86_02660 [Clostridiales bacterium]|nr:hypothetical protein [Clostridiales bacterium]
MKQTFMRRCATHRGSTGEDSAEIFQRKISATCALLILFGIAELILAFLDIKMPVIIAIVLGVLFIALGVKTLLDIAKKK